MAQVQTIDKGTHDLGVSRARRWGAVLGFAALGAVSFWLPDVIIHLDAGPNLDSRHGWAITLFAPAIFLVAYLVARMFAAKRGFSRLGPTMLLGVWLSGGLFMTVAAIASGSEVIGGTGLGRLVVIIASIIPIVTFVLASVDGSLFALLAVTVGGLLICGLRSSCMLWKSAGMPSNTVRRSESHHHAKAA